VTVEAFSCGKAVVTCRDSGGPAELVRDGVNGLVSEPTPESLARALRTMMDDRHGAIRMGEAGAADVAGMTWPAAIATLLA
jgi:glycosyltransferase involved in cell wall biosynthesis